MKNTKAIAEFWQSFKANAAALAELDSADDPLYDELLEKLKEVNDDLYFEFSVQSAHCELIITAEGDQSLFACVDEIVQAAPVVHGWKFFALKPKLGFPKTVAWEGYEVEIADVVFEPLDNEEGELGIRLLVPDLEDEHVDDAHNGLLRAIDHGLGEREFSQAVQFTEVAALDGPASDYIPLTDLEKYIRWRKNRKH